MTKAVAAGVRLVSKRAVVAETSPEGTRLQRAARTISTSVAVRVGRPPCVIIDGLEKRVRAAQIDPAAVVADDVFAKLVGSCGCLPRHAIGALRIAVRNALRADRDRITGAEGDAALREFAQSLARGLSAEDYDVLASVKRSGRLPRGSDAARLFGDGRILAYPPAGTNPETRWSVHPLLAQHVDRGENDEA